MKTNDLKKGTKISLKNGWKGTIKDNKKGNIRIAEVEGWFTEMGSIYMTDIDKYSLDGNTWHSDIEWTPLQQKFLEVETFKGYTAFQY